MTTHDETVLIPHFSTAYLAELIAASFRGEAMIAPPLMIETQVLLTLDPPNPKGAPMTTESPTEQVARLAAETEGAEVLWKCGRCGKLDSCKTCFCPEFFAGIEPRGPLYYFPPTKPAPPSSRETLAANVRRLRKERGWTIEELVRRGRLDVILVCPAESLNAWEQATGFEDDGPLDLDLLDALAKALDTTPAELLTPQETDA